jgi:hypothetical protein
MPANSPAPSVAPSSIKYAIVVILKYLFIFIPHIIQMPTIYTTEVGKRLI